MIDFKEEKLQLSDVQQEFEDRQSAALEAFLAQEVIVKESSSKRLETVSAVADSKPITSDLEVELQTDRPSNLDLDEFHISKRALPRGVEELYAAMAEIQVSPHLVCVCVCPCVSVYVFSFDQNVVVICL